MEGGEGEIELVNLVSLSLSPYIHTHKHTHIFGTLTCALQLLFMFL